MGMSPPTEAGRFGLPWWGIAASCLAGAMAAAVILWGTWRSSLFHPQPEAAVILTKTARPFPIEGLKPLMTANRSEMELPGMSMRVPRGAEFAPRMRVTRERAKVDK